MAHRVDPLGSDRVDRGEHVCAHACPREVTVVRSGRVAVTAEVEGIHVEERRQHLRERAIGAAAHARRVRDEERRAVATQIVDGQRDAVGGGDLHALSPT